MAIYLKNGTLYDGLGNPPVTGGLLIEGDRITALTDPLADAPNTPPCGSDVTTIDCTGKWVMPGFIDAHSHNDFFALRQDSEKFFKPFVQQGITSFVVGNCGFSASGFDPASPYAQQIGGGLFALDEESLALGAYPAWTKAANACASANLAPLAGHGTARIGANGKGSQPLTPERRQEMLAQLDIALQNGAPGCSLGLMYEPGIFAPQEELLEVARLVKKHDRILTVHPKAESTVSLSYPLLGKSHLLRALEELADIVRQTGVRLQYSHLIFVGRRTWRDEDKALAIFKQLKDEGFDVQFDMYPLNYGASVITVVMPEWFMKLPAEKRLSKWTRLKLRVMIQVTTALLGFGFPDITIAYAGDEHPDWIGKTIPELADMWGCSHFNAYLRTCEESGFQAAVLQSGYQNQGLMRRLMRHPLSLYMTDAWVTEKGKQNGGIYGAFPMFLEEARAIGVPIEAAVAKMTGLTAKRFQLKDRGLLRPGAFADVTVVDPAALKSRIDEELPPLGIEQVLMNGQFVLRDGAFVGGVKAGQVLTV